MAKNNLKYVYGVCQNKDWKDEKPCPKCVSREVQKIDVDEDFVCEVCKQELRKVQAPAQKAPVKLIAIIAAVAVLVGGGAAAYFTMGTSKEEPTPTPTIAFADGQTSLQIKAGSVANLAVVTEPESADVEWNAQDQNVATVSADGTVEAIAPGKTTVTATLRNSPDIMAACTVNVQPKDQDGGQGGQGGQGGGVKVSGPSVPWGKYTGPANGIGGEIEVTKSYSLSLNNANGDVLSLTPGDVIQQTKFQNGQLRQGVWIHNGKRQFFTR